MIGRTPLAFFGTLLGTLFGTLLCAILGSAVHAADPPAVEAKHGMVVAAEPLAAEAGVEMLRRGGNAVDAAVATGFALAVTYPVAGNLGGGGFLIATLPSTTAGEAPIRVALDFRETAPRRAHRDLYSDAAEAGRPDASTLGHLAAGVPGSVAGMLHALDRWGTLDRKTVLAPAIRLARDGFAMPRRTHRFLAASSIAAKMRTFDATAALFYPGGEPVAEGALFQQPELAATLERIAEHGAKEFYEGKTAELLVAEMERGGGLIDRDDLAGYRAVERTPITFDFRGRTVVTMPPPSSGGVCLQQMLGMLDHFPLESFGHNSSASLHVLAEVMRRSFADRNRYLGDPDHHALPLDRLLDPKYLADRAASVRMDRATPSSSLLDTPLPPASEQTTHYSVVDRNGGAVSVTTTLNGAFGSKVVVPGAGFLLNNEMDDFAARPGEPNLYGLVQGEVNAVGPGRRPLSSMTPTVVLDERGRVRHVLGTPGGPTIITNVLQVFLNLEVFGLAPQAAVNAPKVHHQCLPDRLSIEPGLPRDVWDALRRRGHELVERGAIGDFQAIRRDPETGRLQGASDPRGGGAARGY